MDKWIPFCSIVEFLVGHCNECVKYEFNDELL